MEKALGKRSRFIRPTLTTKEKPETIVVKSPRDDTPLKILSPRPTKSLDRPGIAQSNKVVELEDIDDEQVIPPVEEPQSPASMSGEPIMRRNHAPSRKRSTKPAGAKDVVKVSDIPAYSKMPIEEQKIIRAKFRGKFDVLSLEYDTLNVPRVSDDIPLEDVHVLYEQYLEKILARESIPFYVIILFVGFLGVEYIFSKIMMVDMGGFAMSQMKCIKRYYRLLIKLGEKRRISFNDSWPPEVSLLLFALFQGVVFAIIKSIYDKISGDKMADLMGGINNCIDQVMSGIHQNQAAINDPSVPLCDKGVKSESNPLGGLGSLLGNVDIGGLFSMLGGGLKKTPSKVPEFSE